MKVEFHCHTEYSKDSLLRAESLLKACQRKGIDRVIVTDHNSIEGALRAKELDPQRVIVGEEILTQCGELLAAFVTEEVPPALTPREAIARLRAQGAFISVSHPFDALRSGHWDEPDLLAILPLVDAIEVFNSRCMQASFNRQAQVFARSHGIAGTVGSDAHTAFEVGRASLLLPEFHDAESLRRALPQGKPQVSLSSPLIHLTSRYAFWKKLRDEDRRN